MTLPPLEMIPENLIRMCYLIMKLICHQFSLESAKIPLGFSVSKIFVSHDSIFSPNLFFVNPVPAKDRLIFCILATCFPASLPFIPFT